MFVAVVGDKVRKESKVRRHCKVRMRSKVETHSKVRLLPLFRIGWLDGADTYVV